MSRSAAAVVADGFSDEAQSVADGFGEQLPPVAVYGDQVFLLPFHALAAFVGVPQELPVFVPFLGDPAVVVKQPHGAEGSATIRICAGHAVAGEEAMIYDNDPRVAPRNNGWSVTNDDGEFRVLHTTVFNWAVYRGDDMELVSVRHESAEAAIRSLIGEPRVAA